MHVTCQTCDLPHNHTARNRNTPSLIVTTMASHNEPSWAPPPGFTIGTIGPDQHNYIVPNYMLPALEQGFTRLTIREELRVADASAVVSQLADVCAESKH